MKSLEEVIYVCLGRTNREDCIELINTHPEIIPLYKIEINTAILLYNQVISDPAKLNGLEQDVPHVQALQLSLGTTKLRKISQINQQFDQYSSQVIQDVTQNILTMSLLTDLKFKPTVLVPNLMLTAYDNFALSTLNPVGQLEISIKKSLSELLAILAISGISTNAFQSIKHDIKDYQLQGFSKKLFQHIRRL